MARSGGGIVLGAPVKLSTLVNAKDEVDFFARPEGLIQNALVVFLRCPYAFFDAQVQVVLQNMSSDTDEQRRNTHLRQRL